MTVIDLIAEGIDIHGLFKTKQERLNRVNKLLETVGHKYDVKYESNFKE